MNTSYSQENSAKSVSTDQTGAIYISGTSYSNNSSPSLNGGGFISKYSSSGALLWTDTIQGVIGIRSVTDAAGNTYATGKFSYSATFGTIEIYAVYYGGQYISGFLAKYNAAGDCIWAKTTPYRDRSFPGGASSGTAIAIDGSGGVYISAIYGFLTKCDVNGNVIWTKNISLLGNAPFCTLGSIKIDSQSNVYITGQFTDTVIFGEGQNTVNVFYDGGGCNHFIAKYDSSGSFQWVRTPEITGSSCFQWGRPFSICADSEGNSYITGYFNLVSPVTFGDSTYTSLNNSIIMAKYNTTGILQWANAISSTVENEAYNIISSADGFLYITGAFDGTTDFGNNTIANNPLGGLMCFVAKYNSNGEAQWVQHSENILGGSFGYALGRHNDNIYMAGSVDGKVQFGNEILQSTIYSDMLLAKIKDEQVTSVKENSFNKNESLTIYPNPTGETFNIHYKGDVSTSLSMTIKNTLGKTVYSKTYAAFNGELRDSINLGKEAKGVYFIEIQGEGIKETRKIVVE